MPTTLLGVVVFLATFAPGYAWMRVVEGRRLRADRSPLVETVELGLIGGVATLIAAAVVGVLSGWIPGLADLEGWASNGSRYFANHTLAVLVTVASTIILAVGGAWGLAAFLLRKQPRSFGPERSVWADVLGKSGSKDKSQVKVAFLAARMKDGRTFEGYLLSFPTPISSSVEEIALQAPIYLRQTPDAERIKIANIESLILMVGEISEIGVQYTSESAADD